MRANFKFWLRVVVAISLGCGIAAIVTAVLQTIWPSPAFDKLLNTFVSLFTLGVGTIFGLFGGASLHQPPPRRPRR